MAPNASHSTWNNNKINSHFKILLMLKLKVEGWEVFLLTFSYCYHKSHMSSHYCRLSVDRWCPWLKMCPIAIGPIGCNSQKYSSWIPGLTVMIIKLKLSPGIIESYSTHGVFLNYGIEIVPSIALIAKSTCEMVTVIWHYYLVDAFLCRGHKPSPICSRVCHSSPMQKQLQYRKLVAFMTR